MRLGEHLRRIDARLAAPERNGGTDGVLRFQHAGTAESSDARYRRTI